MPTHEGQRVMLFPHFDGKGMEALSPYSAFSHDFYLPLRCPLLLGRQVRITEQMRCDLARRDIFCQFTFNVSVFHDVCKEALTQCLELENTFLYPLRDEPSDRH